MKNKIYITTMHRWGGSDTHSYVLFAGDKDLAIKYGKEEKIERGGKYEYEITEFIVNDKRSANTIKDRNEIT